MFHFHTSSMSHHIAILKKILPHTPPPPPPLEWSRRVRRSTGWAWTLTLPKLLQTWLVWGATCWRASSSSSMNWRYPSDHGLKAVQNVGIRQEIIKSGVSAATKNSDFFKSSFYNPYSLLCSSSGSFPLVYLPRSQSIVLTPEQPAEIRGKLSPNKVIRWPPFFRQIFAGWDGETRSIPLGCFSTLLVCRYLPYQLVTNWMMMWPSSTSLTVRHNGTTLRSSIRSARCTSKCRQWCKTKEKRAPLN